MQSCLGIKSFIPKTILLYIMRRTWCFLLSLLLLRGAWRRFGCRAVATSLGECKGERYGDAIQRMEAHPLPPSSPFAFYLSQHPVVSSEYALCLRWPKYWSFSFSIGLFNEYSGLISFKIDWFDLLAVQETLKSLFQHHNLKVSYINSIIMGVYEYLWVCVLV